MPTLPKDRVVILLLKKIAEHVLASGNGAVPAAKVMDAFLIEAEKSVEEQHPELSPGWKLRKGESSAMEIWQNKKRAYNKTVLLLQKKEGTLNGRELNTIQAYRFFAPLFEIVAKASEDRATVVAQTAKGSKFSLKNLPQVPAPPPPLPVAPTPVLAAVPAPAVSRTSSVSSFAASPVSPGPVQFPVQTKASVTTNDDVVSASIARHCYALEKHAAETLKIEK